ncbi:MAG: hypothetical protein SOW65_02150 [Candidatus Enterosoma sp.]|nr:hypothetical protein [bacterium]MDY3210633.1 hypothetical protein [Candidatus Enterosoma sp.]
MAELTDDFGFVGVFNRLFVSAKACNFLGIQSPLVTTNPCVPGPCFGP